LPRPIPTGTPCTDWNLRQGCGLDDSFVEVGVSTPVALGEWGITIENAAATPVCDYEFDPDNFTGPLKALWLDGMQDLVDAGMCAAFPVSGTVYLYNSDDVLVDTRVYSVTTNGNSWAAVNWTDPEGAWGESTPSPGH